MGLSAAGSRRRPSAAGSPCRADGVRTTVASLRLALGVLRAETARGSAEAGRGLDAPLLEGAFRRSDLLLLHLVDVQALARELSRAETAG